MHRPGRIRSDRWYEVALACQRPTTRPAIAAQLGTPPGSVTSLVRSMLEEGLLEREDGPGSARGERLVLTEAGRAELDRAGQPTPVVGGQRLLAIAEGQGVPPTLLTKLAADPELLWAARMDGRIRWIAAYKGDSIALERAQELCRQASVESYVLHVDSVLARTRLAAYAMAITGGTAQEKLGLTSGAE